jgi:hypothetical protein
MISIFTDKTVTPTSKDLRKAIGKTHICWEALVAYTKKAYPAAIEEWNFPGPKYGWSLRIKDKKRAIIYLLPRDKFFKAAFVFGEKAIVNILKSDISGTIKSDLEKAKVYAEGRGIRIDVVDDSITEDLKKLISFKISS